MRHVARLFTLAALVAIASAPVAAVASMAPVSPLAISAPTDTAAVDLVDLVVGGGLAFGMAIRIKDTGSLAKKFVTRATAAAGEYTEGVKVAGADWEQNAQRGADNYKQAVVEAANDGRFERGIREAGAAKYTARASTLGAQRFTPGVQAAEGEWGKNTAPYLDALKGMELPPRSPKGSPNNYARVAAVGNRLAALKRGK